ncbi:MAG: response regulator [Proteobacteria bacterium]|nr:response regulator [Pseudomonadota bacterium]MBU4297707.1 response regulator [Pseudomonadota bacterium]MCG2746477.1 response regulator [Desulfobulbaceae bacterium]
MDTKKEIKKILVVDNNSVILRLMSHMLEEMGYEVYTAVDGLDALEILSGFLPDVIFVDLVMPKINGEKLCRIVRSLPEMEGVFLVIFSAIAAEEQVDVKKIGADACIAKGPFKEIREHVKKVIAMAASQRPSFPTWEILGSESIFEREITKELLSTTKHFEIALNRISDVFFELTPEGKIVYANEAACKMLGLVEEKVLSLRFENFFSAEQRPVIEKLLLQVDSELVTKGEDKPLFMHDRQILLNMLAVSDLTQRFIIVIIHDITERKRTETQLIKQQEDLEKLVAERTVALMEANTKLQQDIVERKKLYDQREELNQQLENALAKVKTLSGFLPICSACKKIRDDKGYWQQLEAYLVKHSGTEFSYSICPECSKKL